MTHEDMLKAIIEAQVRGGYDNWKEAIPHIEDSINGDFGMFGDENGFCSVLLTLLDTEGCKAAYGEMPSGKDESGFLKGYEVAGALILGSWNSEEGNNWRAAIETAYKLLPKT